MTENDDSPLATADIPSTSSSSIGHTSAELSGTTERKEKINLEGKEKNRADSAEGDEQGNSDLEEGEEQEQEEEEEEEEGEQGVAVAEAEGKTNDAPPLPDEDVPPLPDEAPPGQTEDDGWEPVWDENAQAYYFYNRNTGVSQWENPRVPNPSLGTDATGATPSGYNPAIHGDYDPSAPYAQQYERDAHANATLSAEQLQSYAATGAFNRFTGRWQDSELTPENFNDENKSRRQMHAYFDVDAAANSHDGRSLKAERSGKKLTKAEVKAFREKRRERKEEKRRAWLRD